MASTLTSLISLIASLALIALAAPYSGQTAQAAITSTTNQLASGVTSNPLEAANNTYDYIVVGGGLSGLTVASRLSEDPNITVLVVETGGDNRSNPLVYDIYTFGQAYGTSLDWYWPSENNKNISGGKTLGGSSSINGATWTRGLDVQYDSWGSLLEEDEAYLDWSWNSLFGYMKKAENFTTPDAEQKAKGADSVSEYHGFTGPVHSTFPELMFGGPQQGYFAQTIQSVTGIKKSPDLNGGQPNCVSFVPNSLNPSLNYSRSSSAASYLTPVESTRANWLTLVNHHVSQILWSSDGSKFAHGVRFKQSDNTGSYYEAYARKEVILSAGAINTPALLQRSGVGDPTLLSSLGIETVLDLPTVGKNLQEQTNNQLAVGGTGFDVGGSGPADVIAFPNLYELFGSEGNATATKILNSLDEWAESQEDNVLSKEALKTIYAVQADQIINKNAPIVEVLFITVSPTSLGTAFWPLLPFSRGSVKIISTDPFVKPQIQVNYFNVDIDLQIQTTTARLVRKLFQTPPLSTLSTGEVYPGFTIVPNTTEGGSDANWGTWLNQTFSPNSHPLGTCAMMRQSLGGVVDGRLKLYGAENVRIVDASIMPLQISAHLSSTLYGVAEKAADLIKRGV